MAQAHLGALRRVGTAHRVIGVFDLSPHAAEQFAAAAGTQATAFSTLAELLSEGRPDIVHVCTPAGTHYEPARQALLAGAHVYVEKPFVESLAEAESLLALASERRLLICPGHQLLRDRAFRALVARAGDLQPITHVDSDFSFRPPTLALHRAAPDALAAQLLDILPHPLYTLVAALATAGGGNAEIEVIGVSATPTDVSVQLRQGEGDVLGRLRVSLRARPIVSTLSLTGGGGTLTADFARGLLLGAGNEGTAPLEKLGNPLLEGAQLLWGGVTALVRRFTQGGYGGLVELIEDFYVAANGGGGDGLPPVPADQLRASTALYERLAAAVRGAAGAHRVPAERTVPVRSEPQRPVALLTGAGGFLGREIARSLSARGYHVRGIGRSRQPPAVPGIDSWIRADLSAPLPAAALEHVDIVVHAAAETAGGFPAHQRNTIDATAHLLAAMAAARVRRLVLVSSLSVLEPPGSWRERQNEATPLAREPERLGAYSWGKCLAERLVVAAREAGRIEACIVRPGALLEADRVELPGLLGRRLFGQWHLGLGRAGLPLPVLDVRAAGDAIAWCAARFDAAPPAVNLFDPAVATRGELVASWKARGWRGRMVWAPISLLSALFAAAQLGRAQRVSAWSVLRPRRFDASVSRTVLAAAARPVARAPRAADLEDLAVPAS
jgi:predicted dehydrogenase/nucleoside-diphosphate-sugar epimerase